MKCKVEDLDMLIKWLEYKEVGKPIELQLIIQRQCIPLIIQQKL